MAAITSLVIGAVGTGIGVASSMKAGKQAKNAANSEAAIQENNAKLALIAGDEAEATRRQELNDTLSTISAIRASRGLSDSPGAIAVTKGLEKTASAQIGIDRLNQLGTAGSDRLAAAASRARGKAAQLGAYAGAGSSLLSFGTSVYNYAKTV